MLIRLPFREEFDFVCSIGTSCATSSAVAEGTGEVTGTVICSGTLVGRGFAVALVAVVVLDRGREGDRVVGRDGPATSASCSGSRLE